MAFGIKFLYERNKFFKPQLNLARSTSARMWIINACAFMVILQSSISDSFSSLLIAIASVFAALLTEFIFIYKSGKFNTLKDGSTIATALILTLLLPNRISPFHAAMGAVFAIAVIKYSFGGLGSNWLNPALGGWLFIRFSWAASFNNALEGSLLMNGSIPIPSNPLPLSPLDGGFRDFLNERFFSLFGAGIPEGYLGLLNSPHNGIIADRGIFALLLGTIIIAAFRAGRTWVPFLFITVFSFLIRAFGNYENGTFTGDIIFSLFSGGSLVAAFLLISEPASSAKSNWGIFGLVILSAIITYLFRFTGREPYGVIYAVLFINAITPIVKILENKLLYGKPVKIRIGND